MVLQWLSGRSPEGAGRCKEHSTVQQALQTWAGLPGQMPCLGFDQVDPFARPMQEESEEDWEVAASQMAHTIQQLSELAEAEASRQGR